MTLSSTELIALVRDARDQTIRLIDDLSDEQLIGQPLTIVNPLLWEIGHVAWFQEKWILRHLFHESPGREDVDPLYDSAAIEHDTRWQLPLPSRAETLGYINQVRDRVAERIERSAPIEVAKTNHETLAYFVLLTVFHEDMHTEAFTYTRQTLRYPPPIGLKTDLTPPTTLVGRSGPGLKPLRGDADFPGCTYWLGSATDEPFVFDNEKWIHPVQVQPFGISRTAVTQAEFAEFVDAGGYEQSGLWSDPGWRWRQLVGANCPAYWQRESAGVWLRRHFDKWVSLEPNLPMIHVNWFEADAYCRWAGRRLPTESEWELSATGPFEPPDSAPSGLLDRLHKRRYPWGNELPAVPRANLDWSAMGCIDVAALPDSDSPVGCRQMIGNVWEWTASDFMPYAGFAADPYREYSEPWFGTTYKVLRGGAYATRSRLIRNNYRNFYTPDRRDVLAGFRTCRL